MPKKVTAAGRGHPVSTRGVARGTIPDTGETITTIITITIRTMSEIMHGHGPGGHHPRHRHHHKRHHHGHDEAPGPDQQTTAVAVVVGVIVICCGAYAIYWIRENVTPG
ncbi:hypothetical protein JCM8115_000536 [Rhodotorula mucilaginosa]|uniref:Uncharacterized protein n=1 Tax=Rhodotorula mucilaginosa TaxID=5537 RepID=A0A9P6W6S5_RHOMI|nr:hypothetical protein C6P46_005486 [Rhodotorula mucilaginosa]TKA55399.1 hypothetical protein B0A53_02323 [Rhodotorula sp. CCFEE 5036]